MTEKVTKVVPGRAKAEQSPARWGGDAKLERRRRLEPASPAVSKSPNNIATKTGRCVVPRLSPIWPTIAPLWHWNR